MRLDVIGTLEEWQQRHLAAINQALRYSEPVPDYWYPEMHEIYRRMFFEIVKSNVNMDRTLRRFQSEIDQAGID